MKINLLSVRHYSGVKQQNKLTSSENCVLSSLIHPSG